MKTISGLATFDYYSKDVSQTLLQIPFSKFKIPEYFTIAHYGKKFSFKTNTIFVNPESIYHLPKFKITTKIKLNINCDYYSENVQPESFEVSEFISNLSSFISEESNFEAIEFVDEIADDFIGYFLIKQKSLICVDLNTDYGICALTSVFEYLLSNNYLEKVNIVEIKTPKITLGCDPEFEVVGEDNSVIDLCDVDDDDDLEAYEFISGYEDSDQIGRDGSGNQLELRPGASEDPKVVVNNIRGLMLRLKKSGVKISTIGDVFPLGGHIHVGINNKETTPPKDLVYLLDRFIGSPLQKLNGSAREESDYGNLSDIRSKSYGFEYRTPPSAIFSSPFISYIAFKITSVICQKYYSGEIFIINNKYKIATEEEYKTISGLTEKEYNAWSEFLNSYKSIQYTHNIVDVWVKDFKPKLQAVFHQKFDDSIKNMLEDNINQIESKEFLHIHLYGLKESRGDNVISNFNCPNFETIDNIQNFNKTTYGLPKIFRTNKLDDSNKNLLISKLIEKIKIDMVSSEGG